MSLSKKSAMALAKAVQNREVSATEVLTEFLQRIHRLDGKLGCFLQVDEAGARAQAHWVDQEIAAGRGAALPLCGVPIGIKDMIVTKDLVTTAGSKMLAGWVPPYDATVVDRLRRAGALVMGKLNLDEFAMGSSNENSAFKPCRNPWDVSRVPGGSSGGSAAAVAADLCTLTLGTDTGGSIRQPGALCGISALKPTYGRVSRYGAIAFASSLDQIGPMGHSVEDVALCLDVMGGHDPLDSTSLQEPLPRWKQALQEPLRGLRIGVSEEYFGQGLDARIEKQVREALALLEREGAVLVPVSLPSTKYAIAVYYMVATAEASSNLARYDGVRYGFRASLSKEENTLQNMYEQTRAQGFGPEVKRRIMLGTYVLRSGFFDAYYRRAGQVRTRIREEFAQAFQACDIIATPTSPVPAFRLGERITDPLAMYLNDIYTVSANLAGLPGLSIPCGFVSEAGHQLPAGLQLLAAPLREDHLYRVGGAYQRLTAYHTERPGWTEKELSHKESESASSLTAMQGTYEGGM